MKAICISNKNEYNISEFITIGKTYEVLEARQIGNRSDSSIIYKFVNDEGSIDWASEELFMDLDKYREEKIDKIIK